MKTVLWPVAIATLATQAFAAPAPLQPLMCNGTEPFWGLDLGAPGKAQFTTPDSSPISYTGAFTALPPRQEWVWRGAATSPNTREVVAFLREGPCSDGMSDTVHPSYFFSFLLSFPFITLSSCTF